MIEKDNLKKNFFILLILILVPMFLIAENPFERLLGSSHVKKLERELVMRKTTIINPTTLDKPVLDLVSPILDGIPDWEKFMTIDQINEEAARLAKEYPGKIELLDLGKSTKGESILCLKVGEGKHNALIHGFPNSEEPYGGNLLTYLARALAENPEVTQALDYTWYLVPCSDPDAARLNEGFQAGEKTVLNYCMNYYRTPVSICPELTFPFRFGPLDLNNPVPETKALMKVMDKVKLSFISSLHMMKWGGISYMVPFECPELYANLQNAAQRFDVFLRKRPGSMLAPGVMWAEYLTAARNWIRHYATGETNIEPIRGSQMVEYGQQYNPNLFIMIPECCHWYDPRMLDDRPSDTTIGEAFEYGDGKMRDMEKFILDLWKRAEHDLKHDTVFRGMMQEFVAPLIQKYTNVSNPPFRFSEEFMERKATVAQKIGIEGHDDLYRMFYLGGLIRTFDLEVEKSGNNKIKALREEAYTKLVEWDKFLHENYEIVHHPIKNLVGMSIGALLSSAEYAKGIQR
jgi:hypothetical protein